MYSIQMNSNLHVKTILTTAYIEFKFRTYASEDVFGTEDVFGVQSLFLVPNHYPDQLKLLSHLHESNKAW